MSYDQRQWLHNTLETVEKRVRTLRYRIRICCDDPAHESEHDWPSHYLAVVDLATPFNDLTEALNALEVGVVKTERQYRADVLRWLLAETETER